jgi:hypothetical protein
LIFKKKILIFKKNKCYIIKYILKPRIYIYLYNYVQVNRTPLKSTISSSSLGASPHSSLLDNMLVPSIKSFKPRQKQPTPSPCIDKSLLRLRTVINTCPYDPYDPYALLYHSIECCQPMNYPFPILCLKTDQL